MPSSVRVRATLGAGVVFAVALIVAGAVLVTTLHRTMTSNIDSALSVRARDIAALIEGGTAPGAVVISDEDDSLVQIIAGESVVASSSNIEGEPPFTTLVSGSLFTAASTPVQGDNFRILVTGASPAIGPVTIVVGNTLRDVERAVNVITLALVAGIPLLLLLVVWITWTVVGQALRPVARISDEVKEIGATDLHRRVSPPRTDDEIASLVDTVNEMLDRIESGTLRQRRFVSDASHELRTPIATIRHQLETALRDDMQPDWPDVARDLLEEDQWMQRLVDDLLWLARHDQHHPNLDTALVDLDEVALNQSRRLSTSMASTIDTTGIGAGQVRGHRDDLARVVQNLIDNAMRHAVGRVAVSVSSSDSGRVILHVDDDGQGVAMDDRAGIFERFTRGDESRSRNTGGAGLGLSISAEIVTDHNGTLTVSTGPLGGARFTIDLPDARTEAHNQSTLPGPDRG